MKRLLFYLAAMVLLCGCGSTKTSSSSSQGTEKAQKQVKTAKVVTDADGQWVLVAPDNSVVAKVYVEHGSSMPDKFQNGFIRIIGDDGQQVGFADDKGQIRITPVYKAATRFYGAVACVVPFSQSGSATDDAAVGVLDGNESWGVIDTDGRYFYNPVYHREWNDKLATYVYTSSNGSFWVTEDGDIKKY